MLASLGAALGAACGGSSDGDDDDSAGASGKAGSSASGGGAGKASGGSAGNAGGGSGNAGGGSSGGNSGESGKGGTGAAGRAGAGGSAGSAAQAGGGAGAGMAGRPGDAGSAGRVAGGSAGDAGASGEGSGGGAGSDCGNAQLTSRQHARHARSSGFAGTDADYSALYSLPCFSVDDCIAPCDERGGTTEMCAASLCVDSEPDYCLPATVWTGLGTLSAEGTDPYTDCAQLVLVSDPYQDTLFADDFRFEIPVGAEILGITVTIRRAAGGPDEAADEAVRLVKGGVQGGSDRSTAMPWSWPDLVNADYGGPTDSWGQTWSAADLNADDFGVALTLAYPQTAGNGRAYVDIVYVTVTYRAPCE